MHAGFSRTAYSRERSALQDKLDGTDPAPRGEDIFFIEQRFPGLAEFRRVQFTRWLFFQKWTLPGLSAAFGQRVKH